MQLQIGKDKIRVSEVTIHYIHYTVPTKVISSFINAYSESLIPPRLITDEIFNNIKYRRLCSFPKWDIYLIPKESDDMEYFTFKCNDKKLQTWVYSNSNKKIIGDSKNNKAVLLSSTKESYRKVELFGYYLLFDEDTQLYTCKMDYFEEYLYN